VTARRLIEQDPSLLLHQLDSLCCSHESLAAAHDRNSF
jgi:hypothetical protein